MIIVNPRDDLFHRTPLMNKISLVWREHMYVNVYDRNLNFAAVHHFQFIPGEQKGLFNCVYLHGGKIERYSNSSKIPADLEGMSKMSDGRLSIEMVEPKKKIRITFDGDTFKSDLHYDGRFEMFDYKQCPEAGYSPLGQIGRLPLPYNHLQQGLYVKGSVDIAGKKYKLDAIANRDHSWGLRNEMVFEWHYWSGINFEDKFINFLIIKDVTAEPPNKYGGGICHRNGNVAVTRVALREEPEGAEVPDKMYYEVEDVEGKVCKLIFHARNALGPIWFPNRPVEPGLVYEMLDLWGKWENQDTGEIGWGLQEIGKMKRDEEAKFSYAK